MQSKEYKYNRQVFDQKARSMTEKYAKAGTSGNSGTSSSKSKCIQVNSDTNKVLVCDLFGTFSSKSILGRFMTWFCSFRD